jgi:DnaK suppressor protein
MPQTNKDLISEAKLLKMSSKDYMNDEQLAFFKHRLFTMQAELLQNADDTTERLAWDAYWHAQPRLCR